jgi:hypothetical protein
MSVDKTVAVNASRVDIIHNAYTGHQRAQISQKDLTVTLRSKDTHLGGLGLLEDIVKGPPHNACMAYARHTLGHFLLTYIAQYVAPKSRYQSLPLLFLYSPPTLKLFGQIYTIPATSSNSSHNSYITSDSS